MRVEIPSPVIDLIFTMIKTQPGAAVLLSVKFFFFSNDFSGSSSQIELCQAGILDCD